MNLGFTKMHGLGNDFVLIDNLNGRIKLSKEQVVFLCDRHMGIGADGVILVEPSDEADAFMNYINADGSFAQMCGNGVRCITKFLKENHFKDKTEFKIATRSGVKEINYLDDETYSVNMGKPIFSHEDFPDKPIELEGLNLSFVSMGNPHAVVFVEDLDKYDLINLGPKIENNKNFPSKINFEIVERISENKYKVRVWERGCGITLACGTGACAVYAILNRDQNINKEVIINLPGGDLFLSQNEIGEIIMRGPAISVFSSMISI